MTFEVRFPPCDDVEKVEGIQRPGIDSGLSFDFARSRGSSLSGGDSGRGVGQFLDPSF